MPALKPCPFCGTPANSANVEGESKAPDSWQVWCHNCGANIDDEDQETAEKLWNTRAMSLTIEQLAEWWNRVSDNSLITGAYHSMKYDELPSWALSDVRKLYESCQH